MSLDPRTDFLGDALDITAGGGGFVKVVCSGELTGELGFLFGG